MTAISAGLDTRGGDPADAGAHLAAAAFGISLNSHRSQRLVEVELGSRDLLVVMEPAQVSQLGALANRAQVTILGLWCDPATPYIFDPFGMDTVEFDRCYALIADATTALCNAVIQHESRLDVQRTSGKHRGG